MSYGADFVARVEALRRCVVIRRGRRCEDFQGGGFSIPFMDWLPSLNLSSLSFDDFLTHSSPVARNSGLPSSHSYAAQSFLPAAREVVLFPCGLLLGLVVVSWRW